MNLMAASTYTHEPSKRCSQVIFIERAIPIHVIHFEKNFYFSLRSIGRTKHVQRPHKHLEVDLPSMLVHALF